MPGSPVRTTTGVPAAVAAARWTAHRWPRASPPRRRSRARRRTRRATVGASATGSSRAVSRTRPPPGCRNAARVARASSPHSAPAGSCSMRNGGRSGPSSGNAQTQRTTSPSGRTRDPGDGLADGRPGGPQARHVAAPRRRSPGRTSPGPRPAPRAAPAPRCPRRRTATSARAPRRTRRSARGRCRPGTPAGCSVPIASWRPPPVTASPRSRSRTSAAASTDRTATTRWSMPSSTGVRRPRSPACRRRPRPADRPRAARPS